MTDNIFSIETEPKDNWMDNFKNENDIKKLVIDMYKRYNNKYNFLQADKIELNNIEQLTDTDRSNDTVIYVCSFTFKNRNNFHTSILIGIKEYYFIIHNYETTATNQQDKERKLFVLDTNSNRIAGGGFSEKLYFFIENIEKYGFSYDAKLNGSSIEINKHIKLEKAIIKSIKDYNTGRFISNLSTNQALLNTYTNEKYIGHFGVRNNNLSIYKHTSNGNQVTDNDIYIDIINNNNNFTYQIKNNNDIIFELSYSENLSTKKPEIEIKNDRYTYKFETNIISRIITNDETIHQIYSISKKYIPVFKKSTYISALITFGLKVNGLNNNNASIKLIKERNSIEEFKLDDIKKLCGFNDGCNIEKNVNKIFMSIVNENAELFDFSIKKSVFAIINNKKYYIYEKQGNGNLVNLSRGDNKLNYEIPITTDTKEIDLNVKLNEDFDISNYNRNEGSLYYYYYDNNTNKNLILINDDINVKVKKVINDIKKYFAVSFDIFEENGNIRNKNIVVKNLFESLVFKNKLLIPTFMIFYNGDSLNKGHFITIQHFNNNWYVYDHKNRTISNFVNEFYFNEKLLHPVFILYKSFNGRNKEIYRKLETEILKDDLDGNDDTINYYLNPQYELTKYKENNIFNNYDLNKAINSLKDSNYSYKFENNEELVAREFFYGLNNDLNETTILNLHTNQYVKSYINNNFNINNVNIELIDNLF